MVADFADSMVESAIRCSRCYIPLHVGTQELLNHYLDDARHAAAAEGALFRPVSNNRTGKLDDTITPAGSYKLVRRYALALCLKIGAHVLLELSVDKSLNALEPIQFAHSHCYLGYPDHGQSPRPQRRSTESGSRGPKRTFLLSGKRTFLFGYHRRTTHNIDYVKAGRGRFKAPKALGDDDLAGSN